MLWLGPTRSGPENGLDYTTQALWRPCSRRGPKPRGVRDTFLQIPDLRRFLLRGIDVYLYYAHEYTSHTSVPHRTYPPDPTHGARLPLYYRPGTQRSLLQPQLLGKRQKPLPLSAPRQSP